MDATLPNVFAISMSRSGALYATERWVPSVRKIDTEWTVSQVLTDAALEAVEDTSGIAATSSEALYLIDSRANRLYRIESPEKLVTLCTPPGTRR
jgi:hypothetical protein